MKKKFLFIFVFLLFLFFTNYNRSSAASNTVNFIDIYGNNITCELPSVGDNNYVIVESSVGNIYLFAYSESKIYINFGTNTWINDSNKQRLFVSCYLYDKANNVFTSQGSVFFISRTYLCSEGFSCLYSNGITLFCEADTWGFHEPDEILDYNPYGCYLFDIIYHDDNSFCEITSGYFNYSDFENIICEISLDGINYSELNKDGAEPDGEGSFVTFVFWYDIYKNGTYTVRFKNLDGTVLFSNEILIGEINEEAHSLNLHLSTEEQTTEPIYILSDRYYYEGDYNAEDDWLLNYDIDVAYGLESPYEFSPFEISGYDEVSQMNYKQYQYKIVINGIYKFQILDLISGTISYQTFNVTNIGVSNKFGDDIYYNNYNDKGEFDPTPILFLEYVNTTTVRIRTQPFIFNELMYLECYFSSDGVNYEKINNIYKNSIDTGNSSYDYNTGEKQNIIDTYYFYYDVISDGTYYFKFYNIDFKKYTIGSIEVNIQEFLINNVDNIDKYPDKMIIWANDHFGVLTYPFTFCVNLFGKITNINYSEPVLHIPELRSPIGNYKILDSIDFNFNSVVESPAAKNIYNIYLVAVDFILIILFLVLCKNVFSEVFSK